MKFDPDKQYMDYVSIYVGASDLTPEIESIAKQELQKGIDSFIPCEFQHTVKWLTKYRPARTQKVKDDNYEILGLTENDVGKTIDIPAHWTIAWKWGPLGKAQEAVK